MTRKSNDTDFVHLDETTKFFIAGHRGMVGSAVLRELQKRGFKNIITVTRTELDLTLQADVYEFLREQKPDLVVDAAAKVGGIHANDTYPADFIFQNLCMQTNIIHGSYLAGVKRLLFLGSSCIYPRDAQQPMRESCLLTGELEKTNEAYAIAKIAGLKMCEFYRKQYGVLYHSAMPTNLYGSGDNYHPDNSHVLPALIRRFHEAKERGDESVSVWGSGKPQREFLHADDVASAILHLLELANPPDLVNVGCGQDISIAELAELVASIVGYKGNLRFDTSKPDGTPRKLMDCSLLFGSSWRPQISLKDGIALAYKDFLNSDYRSY